MKAIKNIYVITASVILLSSCAVIRPGEVALKVRYGKIQPEILVPGAHTRARHSAKKD